MKRSIALAKPEICEEDIASVVQVLRSGTLSMGPFTEMFERTFAEYIGAKHGIAVNSGTSALHLVVRGLGLTSGDRVVTTPFSFVASSNCLLFEGVRPEFVDIEEETLNIAPDLVARRCAKGDIRAILPVDAFGHPARLDQIGETAVRWGIPVIEDSCESLGAELGGVRTANPRWCTAGVFGFYPNKQLTTGEGGLIVTDDDRLAEVCRSMRNQGRGRDALWLSHVRLGYNYRMDEMSAALGLAQLRRLDAMLLSRDRVAGWYAEALHGIQGVRLPAVQPDVKMSWFVYVIRFDPRISRDRVQSFLAEKGVATRPYFTPIHLQGHFIESFGYKPGDFPITERVASSTLALPFHTALSHDDIQYVADSLKAAIESAQ
ncbi:MAG TPA: DegT/DnrJ/EryC1/StrS family aminotransferase [Symbiobacteriaceae bacterium]|jgi:perosamine synthetase